MSETIPEDIREKAMSLVNEYYEVDLAERDPFWAMIAKALMAERGRAADQVKAFREGVQDSEELDVLENVIRNGGTEP